MIRVDRKQLKFLLAGRVLTLTDQDTDRYKRGHVYSLGVRHNRTICRVEVLKVRQAKRELEVRQSVLDQPTFLARNPAGQHADYVADFYQGASEEPEPVIGQNLARLVTASGLRQQRDRRDQLERQQARSLAIRLREAQRHRDPSEITRIQQELESLKQGFRAA